MSTPRFTTCCTRQVRPLARSGRKPAQSTLARSHCARCGSVNGSARPAGGAVVTNYATRAENDPDPAIRGLILLSSRIIDGRAVNLTPTVDHPVNLGMACPKGWEALTPLQAEDRETDVISVAQPT